MSASIFPPQSITVECFLFFTATKKAKPSKVAQSTSSRKSIRPKNEVNFAEDDDELMEEEVVLTKMEIDEPTDPAR